MYRLLTIFVLSIPFVTVAQSNKVEWLTLNQAEERMAKEPRKVLVDVYTTWCGPCKMLDQNTFQNPQVVEYINKHYYAVKINAEGPDPITFRGTVYKNEAHDPNKRGRNSTHDVAKAIAPVNGRMAYPTIVYMDENFGILAPVQGYHTPAQIEPILRFIAEEAYAEMSFAEYKEKFTPSFK